MKEQDLLDAFAAETEPDPAALARVREAVFAERPARTGWWLAVPALAVAAGVLALTWNAGPTPLDVVLADQVGTLMIADGLEVQVRGVGAVTGTTREPRIRWEAGELTLTVAEPPVGIGTPDAEIVADHADLAVTRGPLGTEISLRAGTASVRCAADGADRPIAPGTSHACWPIDAIGLLRRATEQRRVGAPVGEQLATVRAGLKRVSVGDPIADELAWLEITLLLAQGDQETARQAVDALLARDPAVHAEELRALQDRLRQ